MFHIQIMNLFRPTAKVTRHIKTPVVAIMEDDLWNITLKDLLANEENLKVDIFDKKAVKVNPMKLLNKVMNF